MKDVIVIGGPNGAGKSTAANQILPAALASSRFLNADEIARDLSPSNPDSAAIAAGRLLLEGINDCTRNGESFAFETTCAGRAHVQRLCRCRELGYRFILIFLWLPSADIALARVAQRVANGGHGIPRDVVIRRYAAGIRNMRHAYLPLADVAFVYDNAQSPPLLIAEKRSNMPFTVRDSARWKLIEDATS